MLYGNCVQIHGIIIISIPEGQYSPMLTHVSEVVIDMKIICI